MVQLNNEVVEQIQVRQNLVDIVNKHLAQTFGAGFMGNVEQETYGFTRGPTYHVGDRLGYIAQVKDSQGLGLKLLNQLGMRGGRAVQENDFLFVGKFTDDKGLAINVFPKYEEKMREFAQEYERERKKQVKVKVVDFLEGREPIYFKNNLVKGRENSY